jgi:hypothetical protein
MATAFVAEACAPETMFAPNASAPSALAFALKPTAVAYFAEDVVAYPIATPNWSLALAA